MRYLKGFFGAITGSALAFIVVNVIANGAVVGILPLALVGALWALIPFVVIAVTDGKQASLGTNVSAGAGTSFLMFSAFAVFQIISRGETFFLVRDGVMQLLLAFGAALVFGAAAGAFYRLFAGSAAK